LSNKAHEKTMRHERYHVRNESGSQRQQHPNSSRSEKQPVEPIIEIIGEPIPEQEPKRKYDRKPHAVPEVASVPTTEQIEEPVKQTLHLVVEEMQRAERALRYQMRKNKMLTLVSHAFQFISIHLELN
jgi:hypothetical protein